MRCRCVFCWISLAAALALLAALWAPSISAQGNQTDLIEKALPAKAPAVPKQPRKLLIFSKTAGFRHKSIEIGAKALTMLGDKTKAYTAVHTEDDSFFEPEKLKAFDAVLMLNTTNEVFRKDPKGSKKGEIQPREEMLKKSLLDFVTGGKGLIGIHAATDTYHDWKDYNKMMGGTFLQHPWTEKSKVFVKILEPSNPVNAAFGGKDFDIVDEIYIFRPGTALATERKFLLCLDNSKMDVSKGKREDNFYAISWISTFGKGHTFYCSLGHNPHIYWNPQVLGHYLAGIQYAFGDLEADATPSKKAMGGK